MKHIWCESLRLNHVHSIKDEPMWFRHVAHEEEMCETAIVWSLIDDLDASMYPTNGFNLSRYNSSNERLRLNYFQMIRQQIVMRHVSA